MAALQLTAARPVAPQAVSLRPRAVSAKPVARQFARLVVRAEPETKTAVETAIEQAKETCDSGTTQECAAAWDEVEELAANASHRKDAAKSSDPLEEYCDDNPEADECRVYED